MLENNGVHEPQMCLGKVGEQIGTLSSFEICSNVGGAMLPRSSLCLLKREFYASVKYWKQCCSWTKMCSETITEILVRRVFLSVYHRGGGGHDVATVVSVAGSSSANSRAHENTWKSMFSWIKMCLETRAAKIVHRVRLPIFYGMGVAMLPRSFLWRLELEL